jgi:hypothetical protein
VPAMKNGKLYKNDFERKFKCHARRHMTASEFMTYDAMNAMANRDSGLCFASLVTIANHTNRSVKTEQVNVAALLKKGWLELEEKSRRRPGGEFTTNKYTVLKHDTLLRAEQALQHTIYPDFCPLFKYDTVTGKKSGLGKLKPGLSLANARKAMRKKMGVAEFLDVLVDAVIARKPRRFAFVKKE